MVESLELSSIFEVLPDRCGSYREAHQALVGRC